MSTPMTFTSAGGGLYRLDGKASTMAIADQLQARQAQLQAMLIMTCGEQGEAFRGLDDTHQDNYLWACSMIAREAKELTDALLTIQSIEGRTAA